MSAPRLRARLATTRTASEQTEEDKTKAKKGAKTEDGENEASEDGEGETPPAKKDGKKAAAPAAPVKAVSPEKARMKAITGSEAAGLMPKLAAHLAYDTDLSAEEAEAVMAAAMEDVDTEAAEAPAQRQAADSPRGAAFQKAMRAEAPNPQLGAGGGDKGETEDPWLAAAKSLGVA